MHKLKDRGEAQLQFLRRNLARLRDDIDGKHRQLHLLGLELDNIEYSESFHEDEIRQIRKSAKQDKGQIRRARRKRIKKNIEKIMNDPISFNIAIDHFASVVPKMSGMAHDDTERTQPFNAPAFTGFLHGKSASNVFNTADDKHAGSNSPSCRSLRVGAAASSTPYYVCVRSADDRELKINLANTSELTFEMLLSFVSQYWGVDDNQYMLQTDYSLPVPSKRNCLDWLQHLAVSDRVLHREQPRYIGPREAFQVIDDDKSGQVGVNEFVKLFERSRIPQTKMQAPYVFAAIDKDDSGEVTYAEFAQEWDVIYDVLKRDISWDELPLVYLIPRRVHLRTAAENNGISNFSIGSGKGSENPLGSLVKPESLNMSPLLAFELFDSDQTGSVNFIEFQAVFNKLNTDSEQQSEFRAELRELFNETNTSHSGEIVSKRFIRTAFLLALALFKLYS
jgi:Ca2+-binding EF-hand superfamily protein